MKKIVILILAMVVFGTSVGFAEKTRIAMIPMSDSAFSQASSDGLYSGYNYKDALTKAYNNKVEYLKSNNNYYLVPQEDIGSILKRLNYEITDVKFINKDDIMTIQKETNADVVIALDMYNFSSVTTFGNHFFSTLRCRAYNKNNDTYIDFSINNDAKKSGSVFKSQKARTTKNSLIFMNETFDKAFDRLRSDSIINIESK